MSPPGATCAVPLATGCQALPFSAPRGPKLEMGAAATALRNALCPGAADRRTASNCSPVAAAAAGTKMLLPPSCAGLRS